MHFRGILPAARRRAAVPLPLLLLLLLLLAVAACGGGPVAAPPAVKPVTDVFLPNLSADSYLPAVSTAPVVILVPGGAWRTADRTPYAGLAESLASGGIAVVSVGYRTMSTGGTFPGMVQDVVCAVDFGVDRVRRAGIRPGPVVVLGHSAGGHLAALATLAADHFSASCPYPKARATGLVGLAGAYDIAAVEDTTLPMFGTPRADAPELWKQADPLTWVHERSTAPVLHVFLAYGMADTLVPMSMTTNLADALKRAGHPVETRIVDGVDHNGIFRPEVISDPVLRWVRQLPPSG